MLKYPEKDGIVGDQVLITNNKHLVRNAKKLQENIIIGRKEIKRFLVSTDFTPKSAIKRKYTPKDLADVDIKCSSNKIGEIINLAQMLNSLYWDKKYKGASEEELLDLYKDISNLNILSCIEIDRAKKISPVDAKKELDKIRKKHSFGRGEITRNKEKKEVGIRPMFFKYLDGGKDYKFVRFNTGMDYLNKVLDENIHKWKDGYNKEVPLHRLLLKTKVSKINTKRIDNINNNINEMKNEINKIFASNESNKYELYMETKLKYYEILSKYKIDHQLIYTVLNRIAKSDRFEKYKEYKVNGNKMLSIFFEINKEDFIKNIKVKQAENKTIIRDDNGEIELYGVKFTKK